MRQFEEDKDGEDSESDTNKPVRQGNEADFDLNFWEEGRRQLPPAVKDLRELFRLNGAEMIQIDILGGGDRWGRDFATQSKVREIARVVRRLMQQFNGEREIARVRKVLLINGVCAVEGVNVTGWWRQPDRAARERVRHGEASFNDIMQVQITEWARVVTERVSVADYLVSLL